MRTWGPLAVVIAGSLVFRTRLWSVYGLIALFHLGELYGTGNPLIWNNRGSNEYWCMQAISIGEFWYFRRYYPRVVFMGVVVSLVGVSLRVVAIKTLGRSFSHYIQTERGRLVTGGIYKYLRHPSYNGFYLYVMGIQMVFCNYISAVACMVVLTRFFAQRIRFEEYQLVRNHGQEYLRYRDKTGVYIPFIDFYS